MRSIRRPALPALACLAAVIVSMPFGSAAAHPADVVPGPLHASPASVRPGDTIVVGGTICPTPHTVTSVGVQTSPHDFPKGPPPFVPLNLAAISLQQTGGGTSFVVTAEAELTSLRFQVTCSDGSTAITPVPVLVFPQKGEFWWAHLGGHFTAQPGVTMTFALTTMDCDLALGALATISDGEHEPWFDEVVPFTDAGTATWSVPVPADLAPGVYVGTVTCGDGAGGTYVQSTPVWISDLDGTFPATGGGLALAFIGALTIVCGVLLVELSKRRRP
jgi:hypothetical protein